MSFHPISMKKSELALLYFPNSTSAVATNRLMRWIYDCPPLMMELKPSVIIVRRSCSHPGKCR